MDMFVGCMDSSQKDEVGKKEKRKKEKREKERETEKTGKRKGCRDLTTC